MSLTDEIIDYGLDLGYSAIGITSADPFPQLLSSFEERRADYQHFPDLYRYADPKNVLPTARSIVIGVFDYYTEAFPPEFVGKICRFHMSRCYKAAPNRIGGVRPELMQHFLEGKGIGCGPWADDRCLVTLKQSATRSGVAQFGKNTLMFAPSIGSTFLMINGWVIDRELEYSAPLPGTHCPPGCRACIDACPTGALCADFRLNPNRCITLNTIRNRGAETGISPFVTKDIRPKIGSWLHGCDVCQQACPKNKTKLKLQETGPVNAYLAKKAGEFDLISMLHMTDEYYARVVQPLMYTHIKSNHKEIFRRNAAISLGNLGDPVAVPALVQALDDPHEVVRGHAAWSLGRIGGQQARAALDAHRKTETHPEAKGEIEDALAMF